MNRRQFFKSLGIRFAGVVSLPFLNGANKNSSPALKCTKDPNEKIPLIIIKTHDEGEFWCEANQGLFDDFIENYRTKNRKRLKAAGYKDLIPEVRVVELTRREYNSKTCVSTLSCLYFNGIKV